jgi:hypothetical protein
MRSTPLLPLLLPAGCAAPERPHLATHARSPAYPYLVRPVLVSSPPCEALLVTVVSWSPAPRP